MNEVITLGFCLVIFVVITADSQNLSCALHHSYHIRQRNPCGFIVIFVLIPRQVQIDVQFIQDVAVIIQTTDTSLFVFTLLNFIFLPWGVT